jgi:cytoskeletal protein CcmA (bactofilin family)
MIKFGAKAVSMDTVIGRQTELTGDVRFSGGLHLEGSIRGNVIGVGEQPASLLVGENGAIEGNVHVSQLTLNGKIVGDVHARDRIILGAKARIIGNIHYVLLQMENGAVIDGQLVSNGLEAPPKPPAALENKP